MRTHPMTGDARIAERTAFLRKLALLVALVAIILFAQHGNKLRHLDTPMQYTGDGLSYALMVKQVLDVGWFPGPNRYLGAPFGANSLDYPVSEATTYAILHFLGIFGDWPFVVNAFVILSYFLTAIAAFWVLYRMRFRGPWPVLGALLYTWMPYHPLRAAHLFLSSYHAIPLGVWLAWTVWRAGLPGEERSPKATLFTGVVTGSSGVYYAFFSSYLIVVAMLATLVSANRRDALRRGMVVLAIVAGTTLLNVLPSIVFKALHGPNDVVAIRPFSDNERYALKVIQLVLPRPDHRVKALDELNRRYAQVSEVVNENVTASLGVIATVGFAYLLWAAIRRRRAADDVDDLVGCLSAFNLACVLLGTVGGLSAIFAFFASAQIRGYNRISIMIAFVALAGTLVLLERLLPATRRMGAPGGFRTSWQAAWFAATALLGLGLYDQTSRADLPVVQGAFASDRKFVSELESKLQPGAMVYQMPYQKYPEAGPQFQMENYGPARGYLHSHTLRWSYGTVKRREGDRWMTRLSRLDIARQTEVVAASGFEAVVLDRRGFADHGKSEEEALRSRLGAPIEASDDGELVAYRVKPTGDRPVPYAKLAGDFTRLDLAAHELPATVDRLEGFSVAEPWGRWTEGPIARIHTATPLPARFVLRIDSAMAFAPNVDTPITVAIGGVEHTFKVGSGDTKVDIPFQLSAPASTIEIRIPHPVSPADMGFNTDTRKVGLGIRSISLHEDTATPVH